MLWSCAILESKPELSDLVAVRLHSCTFLHSVAVSSSLGCPARLQLFSFQSRCQRTLCAWSGGTESCSACPPDVMTGRRNLFLSQAWAFARLGKPEPESLLGQWSAGRAAASQKRPRFVPRRDPSFIEMLKRQASTVRQSIAAFPLIFTLRPAG